MEQVEAVGIGSPGPIDIQRGWLISAPNLPLFKNVPIRSRIAEAVGRPAVLENDANAAALAEYWVGAGKDPATRHLIMFTLGTGVGSGLIVDGRIVHGGFGYAGEAGHVIVEPNGRLCGCGQRGCLEAYASAMHVANRASEAIEDGYTSSLSDIIKIEKRSLTAEDVFTAARQGDALAMDKVNEVAGYLGMACVDICRLLDPQVIVLAGGMIQAGDFLLDRVRSSFSDQDWSMAEPRVEIVASSLGVNTGVIGAAAVAWEAHKAGRLESVAGG